MAKPESSDTKSSDKSDEKPVQTPDGKTTSDKLAEVQTRAGKLEGELYVARQMVDSLNSENATLRAEVVALRKEKAERGELLPLKTPKGALRVVQSVLVTRIDTKTRVNARRGDVLLIDASDEAVSSVQRDIGASASVYPIAEAEARELYKLKLAEG